jgi:hypothetical protein
MFILETHKYSLIFRIDNDTPEDYINKWKKIKFDCEEGDNKYIIEKMKTYCKLEQNKNLPYLQREEGGIGGNDNTINKQIRFFRLYSKYKPASYNDKYIVFDEIYNTNIEKWSYDELDDLIYALTKTFNYFVKSNCINGFIQMSNKKCLDDNYLDSDDEFT